MNTIDWELQQRVLHNPFDIDIHKMTFNNYLEVVILEDGTIEYAVPSHQEKMIEIACKRLNTDRDTLYNQCPREYWFDVITWLSQQSKSIAVWNNRIAGRPNFRQLAALQTLKDNGLYTG